MKTRIFSVVCVLGVLTLIDMRAAQGASPIATMEDREASYEAIVTRNAFGLSPPPPPQAPAPPPQPPVNITFAGLTKLNGVAKAYFKLPKEGKPNEFDYPILGVGDAAFKSLKVLDIDLKSNAVRVDNGGQLMTLNYETHGNKATPGPVMAAPGLPVKAGAPGAPGMPNPAARPGTLPSAVPMPAQPGVPPPPLAATRMAVPFSGSGAVTPAADVLQPMPTRSVRSAPNQPPAGVPTASLEEAIVNLEIQRTIHADKIARGEMPPLPPTEMSDPNIAVPVLPALPIPGQP